MTREEKMAKAKPDFRRVKDAHMMRLAAVCEGNGGGLLCLFCMAETAPENFQMGHMHAYRCEGDCGQADCDGGGNESTNVLPVCATCNNGMANNHAKNSVTTEKWAIIERVLLMPLPKGEGRQGQADKYEANRAARFTNQAKVASWKW